MFVNTESVILHDPPPDDEEASVHHHHHHHTHHHHKAEPHTDPHKVPPENGHTTPEHHKLGNGEGGPLSSFRRRGKKPVTQKTLKAVLDTGVNLRDVGANAGGQLKPGVLFRSSELLGKKQMEQYGIKTILDLRRMDRPCKDSKDTKLTVKLKTGLNYLLKGPNMVVPDVALPYKARAFPKTCVVCSGRFEDRYGIALAVQHADLIPGLVGFRLFQAMPKKVRFKAILAGLRGKGAASVMAPAVANPLLMGYKALYRTMLEDSKRGIARAVRVFATPDAFPVLVHCIHGKDRTGLVIALLLMLCDVDPQVIVDDYVQSEAVLKASRMHHELDLDVYLTGDQVIAATRDTMDDTITFINEKYGSAWKYLKALGLEKGELSQIRINLMQQAEVADLLAPKRPARPSIARPSRSIIRRSTSGSKRAAPTAVLPFRGHPRPQTILEVQRTSVRVPGEEEETITLEPRPKSADLGALQHEAPGVPISHRHSMSASASPRSAGQHRGMFGRLSRSISHPDRSRKPAAAEQDVQPSLADPGSIPRSESPTGGRFSAGWIAAAQEPAEAAAPVPDPADGQLHGDGLDGGSRTSSQDMNGRSRRSMNKARLSRPSRRFEDLDSTAVPVAFEDAATPRDSQHAEPVPVQEAVHNASEHSHLPGAGPQLGGPAVARSDGLSPTAANGLAAVQPQHAIAELPRSEQQLSAGTAQERSDQALVQLYAPTVPGSSALQLP